MDYMNQLSMLFEKLRLGFQRKNQVQPHYNLIDRLEADSNLEDMVVDLLNRVYLYNTQKMFEDN
jgi:hypothetical protein